MSSFVNFVNLHLLELKTSHITQICEQKCSEIDHFVFCRHTYMEKCVYLIVYIDYIVPPGMMPLNFFN